MEVFQLLLLKFLIQTWFCICPQYLYLFRIVFECIPSIHDQGKMLVLPYRLLCWVPSTSDQCFVSFQPIWCHPHTQIRITLFHDVQRDIPNLEFSPIHVSIGLSQIAVPTTVLLKDDRTDSFQEERLGLPYWTMILAICVVEDVSVYLDMLIWEFWAIWERPPRFTCVCADTASAACPSQSGSLAMTPIPFAAVVCEADEPCSLNTALAPESSFTVSPRSTTQPL